MMNAIKCQYCGASANALIAKRTGKVAPSVVCGPCAKKKRGIGFEVVARLRESVLVDSENLIAMPM